MRLAGRRALVTGADGGLGSAIARGLAAEGAAVAVHVRRPGSGAAVCEAIREEGGLAVEVSGDVRESAEVRAMVDSAVDGLGGIDVLVNNAGIIRDAPFLELTEEQWREVIDTNLTGYFLVAQATARIMGEGSAIINVSSTRQTQAWAGSAAYTASKGGIAMLTRTIALELAPRGIRVNSIAPGTFETDLNRHYLSEPEFRRKRLGTIPLGRYGDPSEVVGAVVFLASEEASFVVGTSILIDGGQTLG